MKPPRSVALIAGHAERASPAAPIASRRCRARRLASGSLASAAGIVCIAVVVAGTAACPALALWTPELACSGTRAAWQRLGAGSLAFEAGPVLRRRLVSLEYPWRVFPLDSRAVNPLAVGRASPKEVLFVLALLDDLAMLARLNPGRVAEEPAPVSEGLRLPAVVVMDGLLRMTEPVLAVVDGRSDSKCRFYEGFQETAAFAFTHIVPFGWLSRLLLGLRLAKPAAMDEAHDQPSRSGTDSEH